mmetsp:Transcript_53346/g.128414  ORF Transcript_53346/g.128414 Transcript_53346/m.128414 type:complete len:343 (-) Transcript_53346:87-1115(-)
MSGTCAPWAAAAVALLLLPLRIAEAVYSRLEGGYRCWDFKIADITSQEECFNTAAPSLGLNSTAKLRIDGIGFNGCAYSNTSGVLMYSETHTATRETNTVPSSLEYLCDGIPTTTGTSTVTATTRTTTSTSAVFSMLQGGSNCWDHGIPDVLSQDVCFSLAASYYGLADITVVALDNLGFSGCLYNTASNVVMFGVTTSLLAEDNMKQPAIRYICNGIEVTTSTQTATSTTTVTAISATTTAVTTTTTKRYSKLAGDWNCWNYNLEAVTSQEECFGPAAGAVGLEGHEMVVRNEEGFSGCVHNSTSGALMYGTTLGVTPETTAVRPNFEYICIGVAPLFQFP